MEEQAMQALVPHDKIAELAYDLWFKRGCPVGSDLADWFAAELILTNRIAKPEAKAPGGGPKQRRHHKAKRAAGS